MQQLIPFTFVACYVLERHYVIVTFEGEFVVASSVVGGTVGRDAAEVVMQRGDEVDLVASSSSL